MSEPKWRKEAREIFLEKAAKILKDERRAMPARELARLLTSELERDVPSTQVSAWLTKYAEGYGIERYRAKEGGQTLYGPPKHEMPPEISEKLIYV